MDSAIRLDKYLCEMGCGSRREIKEAARKGRILVNGLQEKQSDRKILPGADTVALDGQEVGYSKVEYYMLNKPQGVVSATEDARHGTVVDLITDRKRGDLFPVGRLDIDTEGLLLLTNDGDLAHRLLSPKKHVDKVYEAIIEGCLPPDAAERFEEGVVLEDGTKTRPAVLELIKVDGSGADPRVSVRVTLREGKFHQVKRMFEALGCRVVYLKRVSMGGLYLDPALKPGEYRPLTAQEVELLGAGIQKEMR